MLETPAADISLIDYNWGQPELAEERRRHLLDGLVAAMENQHDLSQAEFLEADRVFTEILINTGTHPYAIGLIKRDVVIYELHCLRQLLPHGSNFDGT